jgi:asparagine synthase (glutamine-hydrolysing)
VCGIAGQVSVSKDNKIDHMLKMMEHRGRDNSQSITIQSANKQYFVTLGHNRLAINDLSPKGNQPFVYNDLYLVVNGEIWNYPTLKAEYIKKGYKFFSNSDSEIILYLYENNELERLDGMYAFILYDRKKDTLVMSRDWVGKIPLWYSHSVFDDFLVASEIKSIIKYTSNIKNFPKNSIMTLDLNRNKLTTDNDKYFDIANKMLTPESNDWVAKKTYELLDNAVQKRLLSDVPIATLNSGGIDSSVITYLLSKHMKEQNNSLKCYTVKFDENGIDLQMARKLADKLDIELIEVPVTKNKIEIKKRFIETISCIEYPSNVQVQCGILTSYMMERIKADGYKVVFSGEGSDEAYGSYGFLRRYANTVPDIEFHNLRKNLFRKQHYGNLIRGNNVSMYYGTIELRMPFFDREFLDFTLNLPTKFLTNRKKQYKLPLAMAFKDCIPDEIINREKMAFQKGTGFKTWIEDVILTDKKLNFKHRVRLHDCIIDNYEAIFGLKVKSLDIDKYGLFYSDVEESE